MSMIGEGQDTDQTDGDDRDAPETVALAKTLGWKDPSEWQGDPPPRGFKSATQYVKDSERVLPLVNARAKNAEERAAKLEAKLEQMERSHGDTIARIERMSKVTLEQQRSQIMAKYAERMDAAAEVGDKGGVQQARKDEAEALKAIDQKLEPTEDEKKKAVTEQAKLPAATQTVIDAWMADNPWYKPNSDDEMSIVATRRHMKLQEEKKGLTLAENLEEVSKYIRKRYPEEFAAAEEAEEEEPAVRRSRVEGGSGRIGGGSGGGKWSKVPADARKAAEGAGHIEYFLKPGETMEKNASAARERWAAEYFEGEQA